MVLPGHLAGGYLASLALLSALHPALSPEQIQALLVVGTLAGELPDIDLLFFNIAHRNHHKAHNSQTEHADKKDPTQNHRDYITHMPSFWLSLCVFVALAGKIGGSIFIEYTGIALLAGTWSHLILDSIEYGILWLAPWSKKNYALSKKSVASEVVHRPGSLMQHFHFIITTYWKSYTIWLEFVISFLALIVLASRL
jgi:hypothetical protein